MTRRKALFDVTRREALFATAAGTLLKAQSTAKQNFRAGIVPAGSGRQASADATYWSNCDAVSALGFHFIEFNDTRAGIVEGWSSRAAEFSEQMAKRRLTLAGAALFSHMADPDQTRDLIDRHMLLGRFLHAVGGSYITHMIAPGAILNEPADDSEYARVDIKIWAKHANEIGKRLANEYGVTLAYHPEQGEIRRGLASRILDASDERSFRLLIDTGHVAAAGKDAVTLTKQYRSRLACIHLKDFAPETRLLKPGNVPVGEGVVDLPAIASFLNESGFAGWVMTESGGTNEHVREYMIERLGIAL